MHGCGISVGKGSVIVGEFGDIFTFYAKYQIAKKMQVRGGVRHTRPPYEKNSLHLKTTPGGYGINDVHI